MTELPMPALFADGRLPEDEVPFANAPISARTYRLMRHYATVANVHTPDLAPGLVVWEQWATVTHDGLGNRTEVAETPTAVASTLAFDDETFAVPGEPGELHEDEAEEALRDHGFVMCDDDGWTRQADGQWRADVDYYDPTP